MRIRSITAFLQPEWPLDGSQIQAAGLFLRTARQHFSSAGFEVQTVRLATTPFPTLVPPAGYLPLAAGLEQIAAAEGVDYLSLGPALPSIPESYTALPGLLEGTQNVFFSAHLGDAHGIHPAAARACAEVITRAATITPDGFTNLRFTALANVRPGTPFFPAAYSAGGPLAFAIATEAADLGVSAFEPERGLAAARAALVAEVEELAARLRATAETLAEETGVQFNGIDFTLAPFPEDSRALGAALERMGLPAAGLAGSLTAAAVLTDTLDEADFARTGFCGLMLPVLEDSTLARRAADGSLSVFDLLLYSAVCGTGLDCIPLPGGTPPAHLEALLLDVAVLAYRLAKPLTARLMPIPGKAAGDPIEFDFAFFANSRIMPLKAAPLTGALAGDQVIPIRPTRPKV